MGLDPHTFVLKLKIWCSNLQFWVETFIFELKFRILSPILEF